MRGADFQGKWVETEDGRRLGRVFEVHLRDGEVIALVYGARGLLQRFTSARVGRRAAWSDVVRMTGDALVIRSSGDA